MIAVRVLAAIFAVLGLVCVVLLAYVGVGELRWRYGREIAKRERDEFEKGCP